MRESIGREWLRDCNCDCMQTAAKRHYHWPIWMIIRSLVVAHDQPQSQRDHDDHRDSMRCCCWSSSSSSSWSSSSGGICRFRSVCCCTWLWHNFSLCPSSPTLLPISLSVHPLFPHSICGASRSLSPPSTEAEAAHKFFICLVFILFRLMYFYFQLCTYFLLLPPPILLLLHLLSSFASFRVVFNIFFSVQLLRFVVFCSACLVFLR